MLSILSGVIIFGAGATGLWYIMPRNGQIHRLAKAPLLDSLIPIALVTAFGIGTALIVAGVAG